MLADYMDHSIVAVSEPAVADFASQRISTVAYYELIFTFLLRSLSEIGDRLLRVLLQGALLQGNLLRGILLRGGLLQGTLLQGIYFRVVSEDTKSLTT